MRQRDLIRSGGQGQPPPRRPGEPVGEAPAPAAPVEERSQPKATPPAGSGPVAEEATGGLGEHVRTGEAESSLKELHAADHLLQAAVDAIEGILQAVRADASVSIAKAEEGVENLLRSLEASDALLVPFFSAGGLSPNLAREAVNVCILSLKIGLELGYAPESLRKLGLAALLCDVGMARVPAEILGKRGGLTPDERAVLETTQRDGANLVQTQWPEYRWVAEVIARRYETIKEPRQPENGIGEYAAIVRLADIAESLIHHRPFRQGMGTLEALKKILLDERTAFPDKILKGLIRILSTFPVGSLVLLNTGEIGRVVQKNTEFPLRPVVEVLVRQSKWLNKPAAIDLSRSPLHHVQDSFLEEALPVR